MKDITDEVTKEFPELVMDEIGLEHNGPEAFSELSLMQLVEHDAKTARVEFIAWDYCTLRYVDVNEVYLCTDIQEITYAE